MKKQKLNKWGLPVDGSLQPHNPDGLTADVITEGGKYRAWSLAEFKQASLGDGGVVKGMQQFRRGAWVNAMYGSGFEGSDLNHTYRVPVNTPFPKAERHFNDPNKMVTPVVQPNLTTGPCPTCGHGYEGIVLSDTQMDLTTGEIIENPTPEQSSSAQSDTPRTDASLVYGGVPPSPWMPIQEVRKLERELTAALWQRDEARRLLGEVKETLELIHSDGDGNEVFPPNPQNGNSTSEEWESLTSTLKQITEYLK